ncbi:MAG: SBBP repeat-containing protein [Candidatus Aminicenantes bacterium]|nr:SBBP repeat-containing protein [Candidatus Aminicenantes bacterium]
MRKIFHLVVGFVVLSGILFFAATDSSVISNDIKKVAKTHPVKPKVIGVKPDLNFGKFPLYFFQNKGQVKEKAKFYAKTSRYTLWLTKEGLVFDSVRRKIGDSKKKENALYKSQITNSYSKKSLYLRDVSRLCFIGANENTRLVPMDKSQYKVNYYRGRDSSTWNCDIPTSLAVAYENLYKSIDLKLYGNEKQIEYDWIIKPGGNPADIQFTYENVIETKIDKKGNLVIKTKFGELIHKRPRSYQNEPEQERASQIPVNVTFKKIEDNTYGFTVGKYDNSRTLIIDPVVLPYSTYLGGDGMDAGHGIATDGRYVYVTGYTNSSDFPEKYEYECNSCGNVDAYVTKIDTIASGINSLVGSSYLGGNGLDMGYAIAVDNDQNVYITGETQNAGGTFTFPIRNGFQRESYGRDTFVARIDTKRSGDSALIYSTFLGGDSLDRGLGIIADNNGNVYVTGATSVASNFPIKHPITNPYMGYSPGRKDDAFITKINTGLSDAASLIYSTFLGGGNDDFGSSIAIDNEGNAYITGRTGSIDFPTSPNAYQPARAENDDAFVTKVQHTILPDGEGKLNIVYSTFLGGDGIDGGRGIAVDPATGNAFIAGTTDSTDSNGIGFPVTNNPLQESLAGGKDAFISKINTLSTNGALSLEYSTYLGGTDDEFCFGIALNSIGNQVFITGTTYSEDFRTVNEYSATKSVPDAFVSRIKIKKSGESKLIYSTRLTGPPLDIAPSAYAVDDCGRSIAVDIDGNAYVTGYTKSADFPTSQNPAPFMTDPSDNHYDAFVTKLRIRNFLLLESPNGGELLPLKGNEFITWDTKGIDIDGTLTIRLQNDNGFSCIIAQGINPVLGTYPWTIGACGELPGPGYKIRIESTNGIWDESDDSFSITGVVLTSPYTSDDWMYKNQRDITWIAYGTKDLRLILTKNGVKVGRYIAHGIDPSSGRFGWTVGQYVNYDYAIKTARPGPGYKVKIREIGVSNPAKDISSEPFDITGIAITYPKVNNKVFSPKTIIYIRWVVHKVSGNLKIVLKKYDEQLGPFIIEGVPQYPNFYRWEVGKYHTGRAVPGYNYKIEIENKPVEGNLVFSDESASFDIKGITVILPNGREDWKRGRLKRIYWEAPGITIKDTFLRIYLYKDNDAKPYGLIRGKIDPTPAPGSYPRRGVYLWSVGKIKKSGVWTLATFDNQYKIKIVGVKIDGLSVASDESDAYFKISD